MLGTRFISMAISAWKLLGHRIADGVGNVDRRGPGLDRRSRPCGRGSRARCAVPSSGDHSTSGQWLRALGHAPRCTAWCTVLRFHLQLVLHVQRAGRDEGVDARLLGVLQGCPGAVDVLLGGPRQAGHGGWLRPAWRSRSPPRSRRARRSGKPASMMSTPISSSTSATWIFSSRVMEQPGDCSPSRKVVSKMTTRSLSLSDTDMAWVPWDLSGQSDLG